MTGVQTCALPISSPKFPAPGNLGEVGRGSFFSTITKPDPLLASPIFQTENGGETSSSPPLKIRTWIFGGSREGNKLFPSPKFPAPGNLGEVGRGSHLPSSQNQTPHLASPIFQTENEGGTSSSPPPKIRTWIFGGGWEGTKAQACWLAIIFNSVNPLTPFPALGRAAAGGYVKFLITSSHLQPDNRSNHQTDRRHLE